MKRRTFLDMDPLALQHALRPGGRDPWGAVRLLAAIIAYVLILTLCGCQFRAPTAEEVQKVGGAVAAATGNPWVAVGVGAIALLLRKFERGRLVARHEREVTDITRRANAAAVTAIQRAGVQPKPYTASDQIPNGDGLVPHG